VLSPVPIPEDEIEWQFARSGGPGGQNVNKVSSKAVLTWNHFASPLLSEHVKHRIGNLYPRYVVEGVGLKISSQEHRDQERNKQACLEKLQTILAEARTIPKPRRATRPTRGSKLRRLDAKKHRGSVKANRKQPRENE
jgi:ribosome-associated protein